MDATEMMLNGVPIATSATFASTVGLLGIKPLELLEGPLSLEEYQSRQLTDIERKEIKRFAPKLEMIRHRTECGKPFTGFRVRMRQYTSLFALIPHPLWDYLVPIVVEYMHGIDAISVGLPSGCFKEGESSGACAQREFEEETGILIENVRPLGRLGGIPVSCRNNTQTCQPFLGVAKTPLQIKAQNLDETESLRMIFVPIREWLRLIAASDPGKHIAIEGLAIAVTLLALSESKRLQYQ